jgi:hypothetical protein
MPEFAPQPLEWRNKNRITAAAAAAATSAEHYNNLVFV